MEGKTSTSEDNFLNDMALIAQLMAEIPASCQERWHLDKTNPSFEDDKKGLGSKFEGWLDHQRRTASSAHPTQRSVAYAEIKKEAPNRPVGSAGLLVSMTERRLHAEGGRTVDKMQLSDTLLGCGQVLTGVAPRRTGQKGGERLPTEYRATQGALADKPPQGRTFGISDLGKAVNSVLGLEDDLEARIPPLGSACQGCAEG